MEMTKKNLYIKKKLKKNKNSKKKPKKILINNFDIQVIHKIQFFFFFF